MYVFGSTLSPVQGSNLAGEEISECAQHRFVAAVVGPWAYTSRLHESRALQQAEVAGDGGLRKSEFFLDRTYTDPVFVHAAECFVASEVAFRLL